MMGRRGAGVRVVIATIALAGVALHCSDQGLDSPRTLPLPDGGRAGDAGAASVNDSGCPTPRVLGPDDAPHGYLPAVKATLVRPIDGDTAHFDLEGAGEQSCRFLFVDTEESFGDETTPFGVATKETMESWLRAAQSIVVRVREAPGAPGEPEVDTFGRRLSLVFLDGELVQTRLVREGLSVYFTPFGCATEPIHSTLLHAEAEANAAGLGVWSPSHPKDYKSTTRQWIGRPPTCRPDPFVTPYCP